LAVFSLAAFLLGGAMGGRVAAQEGAADEGAAPVQATPGLFLEDKVDSAQKKNQNSIGAILRAGKFENNQQKTDLETYYKTYALARWTQAGTLGSLQSYRKDLINNLKQAKSGEVHDYLNKLVLEYMTKLAKGNYHPAVRVNAMLMIGDLNSTDGMLPTQDIPWNDAMPVLLEAVGDANQIAPVKVAAMVGINRHVTAAQNNTQIQLSSPSQISSTLVKLLGGADAADTWDDGQVWLRRQAMDVLGLLGSLGANNQLSKLLASYAGAVKMPLRLRLGAANALGKLKYAGASGLNPMELAKPLAQLMIDICDAELNAKGTPAADRQRRMKARMASVFEALNGNSALPDRKGIISLATGAQKIALDNFQSILNDLLKTLDKDVSKLSEDDMQKYNDDLKKALKDCQNKLKDWMAKQP
jgi:hypothetical protein